MNLFNKYVKKEIFSIVLFFLPNIYIVSKRSTCKIWYEILTSSFIKNSLKLLNKPCGLSYYNFLNPGTSKSIKKINNSIYNYSYYFDYVNIIDKNGKLINTYKIDPCIDDIIGYNNLIWKSYNNITICDSSGKRKIRWKHEKIYDMETDGNHIYFLTLGKIFKYNTNGEYIKHWSIDGSFYSRIVIDKEEIYFSRRDNGIIDVYSNDGKLIRKIYNNDIIFSFDVCGDYIYIINVDTIKILTKEGEIICCKNHHYDGIIDLFVIDDIIYVSTNYYSYIYQIKFY
jgi:hypothetical protein